MKRVKLFILTYNNPEHFNDTLNSLKATTDLSKLEVHVINNHSRFIPYGNNSELYNNVIHNNARPDWSTGHPGRNWNQALMFGFKNLTEPDADVVITVQDDTIFREAWLPNLLDAHKDYDFIMDGIGDTIQSWTAEGVRHIGLWDERYCGLAWGEADYQTMAVVFHPKKVSITTGHPLGQWNPLANEQVFVIRPRSNREKAEHKSVGDRLYKHICADVYNQKWGFYPTERRIDWIAANVERPVGWQYVLYPYFEKDVYDLEGKRYVFEEWKDAFRRIDGVKI
jgi:hypothetical protein